jgi:predicted amidophosphoribosyltransferase
MYCWDCGERVDWDEVICPECGAPTDGEIIDDDGEDWGDSAYHDAEGQFRDDDYYP